MTNNEIIINQAIAHGIYTKAEAQTIVAAKGCLPITKTWPFIRLTVLLPSLPTVPACCSTV